MKITEINGLEDSAVERDATAEEIAEIKAHQDSFQAAKDQEEAEAVSRAEAKAALLERLGMTQEEAALLLS